MDLKFLFYGSLAIFVISAIVLIILAIKTLSQPNQKLHLTENDLYDHKDIHEDFIQHRFDNQASRDSMVRSSVRMHCSIYFLEDEFQKYKNDVLSVELPQKNKG